MNKTYKVIYNRTRCMYQVVSELAKGRTKSETPEMLKNVFSKHGSLARGIVMAVLSMSLAMPVGVTVQAAVQAVDTSGSSASETTTNTSSTTATDTAANVDLSNLTDAGKKVITDNASATVTSSIGTLSTDGKYIKATASVSVNLSALDTQVKSNADAISAETTARTNADTSLTNADTSLTNAIGTLSADGNYIKTTNSVTGNLSALDTQAKANADAIAKETENRTSAVSAEAKAREDADTALSNKIGTTADGNYVKASDSVATNLGTLDTRVKKNADAIGTNTSNISTNTTDITNLKNLSNITDAGNTVIRKQAKQAVKVAASGNATVTTSGLEEDGSTLTYTINVAHNGTISAGDTNLVSGGTLYTELRPTSGKGTYISAGNTTAANLLALDTNLVNVVNALGLDVNDTTQGYTSKLSKYFKVNPEITTDANGTKTYAADAAVSGTNSVAIGPSASVDTASDALALGTGTTVNQTATSGVAIGKGAVTGSADKTITVNNLSYAVKAAGGENSVAIGTDASSAGNTSLALGKGATVENDSDGSYQAVVKSDDIAVGTGARTTASDASTAIGKGASVAQSTDALAIGSSAAVGASATNAMALGKEAAVGSGAADSIAMGTSAKTISADTIAIGQNASATGANSVVIGKGATTTSEGGNAIGLSSTASGSSTAIGQSATANNYNALAIGNNAKANADKSISLGYNAGVGTNEGKGETQNAGSLIAIGTSAGNNVSGMQNVAIGESAGSNVKSSYNIAIGTQAGYGINYASDNKVQNGYNVSIGYKANYQENAADIMYATALGNEANASNYAVAIGDGAKASGNNSLALGYSAQASDAESMALGHNASAADGNVAIGNGSSAPAVSSLGTVKDGYVYQSTTSTDSTGASTTTLTELKSAFTYKPLASDSHYISVGTSTLTRRISNVADGVFDSDAATVGQLNSLNELLQATDTKVGLTKDYFEKKFTALNTTVDASKTHYFSVSTSSDNQTVNQDNTGATSGKADAMAIGPNANATNVKSLAVGNNVYATGLRSIAIGTAPNPTTDSAGTTTTHNTSSEGENSIALGTSTTAQADNSIAIGTRAQTYTTDTTSKTGAGSVAIGNLATTAGNQSVALGYDATVKYDYGTAIGSEALASGTDAVAVGKGSKAYSTDSTAIGQNNTVTGSNVYGLGSSNAISGNWGSIVQSGVSGYQNTVTSVSDQDTTNALTGVYMTGSSNTLNQNVKYNVMQDITVQGSSNTINGGAGGTSGHPNTLSQIAIVGSGNTVQGKSSDDSKTNNIKDVTILGYNNKVDANTDTTVDFSNTQILGSNVTAKLGNSVYLGSNAAYTGQTPAASDAITSARTAADAAAEASDAYKAATTDAAKAQIKAQYEAQYLYQLNVQAMEASGTTAGTQSYSTDETYGDGTSYTYAGSSPAGVVTVGSVGAERRIQNVAAGLVSATSTDAVNGSQLYALTRQIRFGGDNSSFGTTTADDKNVVARGSNETIAITGGSDAVTASTTDGNTTYTVDATKLTDNNIAVVADTDNEALHVQLASNLKNLNTAQLGSGSGDSYKETIKLDGTGANGGQMTLAGADGTVKTTIDTTGLTVANGPKFTSSGIDAASQKINHVTAGSDDADAVNYGQLKNARTLLTKGANTTLSDTVNGDQHTYTVNVDNLAVKANGTGTTVALANGINFRNGTNTTSAVGTDGTVTIDTKNLTVKANGTNAGSVTMDTGLNFKDGTNTTVEAQDGTVKINATHNKVSTVSAAAGNQDNVTLTLTDTDGNQVASTGLKNTYTTISKDGTAHTVTFARNDGVSETLSLGDLNGASKDELTASVATLNSTIQTEAAKASSEVTNGTNVASVTKAAGNNNQNIYTVNVDDLAVKVNSSQKSVHLKDGLVFGNGTNTTATMSDDGTITYNISDATIKTRAKDAINLTAGSNVTVDTTTSVDGTTKTFTVKATHNKLASATAATGDQDNVTLTLKDADGNEVTSTGLKNTYSTGGSVTYAASGEGTATVTRNDGNTYTITGLKDTKVSSGKADYTGTTGTATLTMNDGTTATITGLQNDYVTTATVTSTGTNKNHVTLTRLGGGTVDVNLNPILDNYSLSDYQLVGNGDNQDQAYTVGSDGTVTLNVVDSKNAANKKTIQITGLASQSGVTAGRTTVQSSDSSVKVTDSTANGDTHTYDIQVDYAKIPANLKVQYSGDNGTTGSNTMDTATAFNGTAGQIETTAENGKVTFKLANDITGINSVTTGNAKLDTNGLTIQENGTDKVAITSSKVNLGGNVVSNIGAATADTDAATLGQVKSARTAVAAGSNVSSVAEAEATDGSNQKTYTVNVDNLSVRANNETAKSVALGTGLTFNNGTNTTATVGENGVVTYSLNDAISLTSVKTGSSLLDTSGLTITGGPSVKTSGIDAGSKKITGVANGENASDAVNKGQLDALQTQVNSASFNVKADNSSGAVQAVKAGDTVTFANDSNLTLVQGEKTFTYGLNKEINISKVTTSDPTKGSTVQTAEGVTTKDAANNVYQQNASGITLTPGTLQTGKTAVKLTNTGLDNGGNAISNVAAGTKDTDVVNVSQLKDVEAKVGNGWQLTDADGKKVADIGAGKQVSFKSDNGYLTAAATANGTTGATVTLNLKNKSLETASGKVKTVESGEDGLATAKNVAETINSTYWTAASGKTGTGTQEDKTTDASAKQISAGGTVTFNAGNNLALVQNGSAFTYGLQSNLTDMDTISFTARNDADGKPVRLIIGKQANANGTTDGYFITGLDNTTWNQSNYVGNRAATEAQLASAIKQVTLASQSGGFKLSDDKNKEVSQVLGQAIGVVGDGNVTTAAETTTTDTNGHIKVSLNKDIDLTNQGSVTVGQSKLTNGQATIGGVTVNGTEKTVTGLSNTTWEAAKATVDVSAGGYQGSTKAATESQLAQAISTATTTAAQNEQHIKAGTYEIGQSTTDKDGNDIGKNSVAINVVSGEGANEQVKGQVIIKDVAKASDVGDTAKLADDIKNKNGNATSVVDAVNNLNGKVGNNQYLDVKGKEIQNGDSSTTAIGKLNNRMNDIYSKATQHSTVIRADDNVTIQTSTNADGGTNYQIGLNKEKIDLGKVTIQGNEGSITAKSMTADTFMAGNTVVSNDGVKIGDKSALTSDTLKVNGKTYVSGDGLNANSQKITNVADGSADTDAVNVKQVNDLAARQGEAITENAAHIGELGRAVNKLGNRLNRVGAGAAALAALHPGTYDPNDKWDFSAGIGHYHDANAVAIGAYYHPNDTTILSIGGSMGGGENMVNAGITWKMGRSGHEQRAAQPVVTHPVQAAPAVQQAAPVRPAPVTTPAPVVTSAPVTTPVPVKAVVPAMPAPAVTTTAMTAAPSGDTAALTQILARQTAILEKLAQNQSQAARPAAAHGDDIFPDVPDNHWAYAYVAKLEKAGALKGFKRPAVLKSPMMTRDDFATVLYTAMANGATTNPALNGDDSLNRLAQEFKAELKDVKP